MNHELRKLKMNVVTRGDLETGTLTHVNRDPCPKCGVRGDVGCKHNKGVSA